MNDAYDILDDSLEYYRHLGIDDAQIWIKGLIASDNVPDVLTIDDAMKAANFYFDKYYEEKGVHGTGKKTGDTSLLNSLKETYEKAFTRKALLYIKECRKKQADEASKLKELKSEYALEGGVEAAKWFAAIYDADFAKTVTESDAERIAQITFNYLHDTKENKELRTSFIGSFIRVSRILFSSIRKENESVQEKI